ncbi:MAG: dihydroorotase [Pseudomonadota bacterium]|nr:dihydroorotase [Pseudomonadota bacterium]
MTIITKVLTSDGARQSFTINDGFGDKTINGEKLLALPGLIDPHVHFRVPGMEYKEDWVTGAKAAFKGGYSVVFDMPNTQPATTTQQRLIDKINIIDNQIKNSGLPLKYKLFFGADKNNFQEIEKVKDSIVGIKVFMGSSTGELLMDDLSSLHAVYALAKAFNLTIALHAEDELIIQENTQKYALETDFKYHSIIRSVDAAVRAVTTVIQLVKTYGVKSYILHLSSFEEIELVKQAKLAGLPIFAETCPHYLFLDDSMYDELQGLGKMNPPLRNKVHQDYLWQAVADGVIDTIGSDHAPHTLDEKQQPLCKCPSGVPGIETTLPLMLTAYKQGKVSLDRLIGLLHDNPQRIFNLEPQNNWVLANIVDYKPLTNDKLCTKSKWSPYAGMNLTGYPEYFISNNRLINLQNLE